MNQAQVASLANSYHQRKMVQVAYQLMKYLKYSGNNKQIVTNATCQIKLHCETEKKILKLPNGSCVEMNFLLPLPKITVHLMKKNLDLHLQ